MKKDAFNYDDYIANNPLMREYIDSDMYDNMDDDQLDAAEKAGDLNPSDAPLGPDEELMNEEKPTVPDNVVRFAKKKGVLPIVRKVATWANKEGKRVVGGTAIGKNYDTLVLDLTHQGSEIYINCDTDEITVNDQPVYDYESFSLALDRDE
jgi:hypothetical protein